MGVHNTGQSGELKYGFIAYLKENTDYSVNSAADVDSLIFEYDEEYKDYLTDECGVDSSYLDSKTINEIIDMDFGTGQISEIDSCSDSFVKSEDETGDVDISDDTDSSAGISDESGTENSAGRTTGKTTGNSSKSYDTSKLSGMTLSELETEKTSQEGQLNSAREAVNAVYNGTNSNVQAAETKEQEALEAYNQAVQEDENISEDLKQRRTDNLEAISTKESEIDNLNVSINDKESEITSKNSDKTAEESNLSALKSSLSSLQSQSSEDSEVQQAINNQIAQVQKQISASEDNIKTLTSEIETLEAEKAELEENLSTAEGELETLEKEKTEIEKEISENCGQQTQEAMDAYNAAKENTQAVKTSELSTAKGNVSNLESYIDSINNQINEKKAEETKKNYSVSAANTDSTDSAANSSGVSGSSGGGGVSGSSGGSGVSGSSSKSSSTSASEVLKELEKEKTEKEQELNTALDEVNAVYDGTNSNVKEAEAKADDAKKAYDNAVSADGNITADIKQQRTENLEAISTKENDIDEINVNINNIDIQIFLKEQEIEAANSNLTALNTALTDLQENSSDSDKISEVKKLIKTAEEEISKLNEELEALKKQKETYQSDLDTAQSDLDTLKDEKSKIEDTILSNCSDTTKSALEAYNEAKNNAESVKESELKKANSGLNSAKSDLTSINSQINEKNSEVTTKKYSAICTSLDEDLVAGLDAALGDGFCARLEELCTNVGCSPEDLLGVMYSESGLNPSAQNANGGATGLIQFLPTTASGLGTSTSALKNMSAIEQLDYVEQFLLNNKSYAGGELDGGTLYALVFLPAYASQEVLCSQGSIYYSSNSGLDLDGDGSITKTDLANRVQSLYQTVVSTYT
ncbi:MAG: hypothetical protein LUG16_08820 [Candidatus Gastranaerophilales bacterium]|nr:hypothetical protein [Candidatus Gastranaerophilales bacterium]